MKAELVGTESVDENGMQTVIYVEGSVQWSDDQIDKPCAYFA